MAIAGVGDGVVVQVVSAPEQVSVVESEDTHLLCGQPIIW